MNRFAIGGVAVLGVIIVIIAMAATYTVHQAEQALVVQFGEPRRLVSQPGLHFKIPFVEDVLRFDKRVLDFDAPVQEIPTLDQKQVIVSAFAKFRIVDTLKFFQVARDERTMRERLAAIIGANLRQVLGRIPMQQILTEGRADLMEEITKRSRDEAASFGIEVMDVRMKRVDLPDTNSQAVFGQMRTQREQEAKRIRAEGERESLTIKAEADRDVVVIVAKARKQAEILRGEGDGRATAIYNAAYGSDPKFFDFFRSMQALRAGLPKDTTTFVGPPTGEFFRYFSGADGEAGDTGPLRELPASGMEPAAPADGSGAGDSSEATVPPAPEGDAGADTSEPPAGTEPDSGAQAPDVAPQPDGTAAADAARPAQSEDAAVNP
jgi:membrane protease subunit HflC